jgi:superfamily II DNA or RNA helicase
MLVLHAGADNGQLLLWGEVPADAAPTRPGRKPKAPVAQPYPYDAGAARLVWALAGALPGQSIPGNASEPARLWLPTVKGQPVPSSPLIADGPPPGKGSAPELAPWTATALRLPVRSAVDLLCAIIGRETLGGGVLVGPTLAYWATALRFSAALVAREQLLPGIEQATGGWRASWRPVFAGAEGQRLARLARAMPPACRAVVANGAAEAPPDRAASEVLAGFVSACADALVRAAVAEPPSARRTTPTFPSLHDRWAYALRSPDGALAGADNELGQFAEQVRSWQRPVLVSSAAPFQLCFRLEEPPEDRPDGPWRVRYLLQARDDPSLLIPVAAAWAPRGRTALAFKDRHFQPREYLLTALGQAAALCPAVEASLKSAAPAGFSTDAGGAHRFLNETAWLLEQAGFGVLLPAWWTRHGTARRLTVRAEVASPRMQAGGGISLADIVQFDWKLAIGDLPLTLEELEALARLKAPLVRVRGQWVQVNAEEVRAAIDLLRKRARGEATLRQVVQMALGGGQAPGGLPFGGVTANGWVGEFLAQLEGKEPFAELPVPEGFHGTLRPYQVRGYSWLAFLRRWGLGACLADDMGLGKTIQTLALLERDWPEVQRPTLLICPTSVVGNWKKEAERFTPGLPVLVHHGGHRARGAAFAKEAEKHALVLTSYALLYRDREVFDKVQWAGVVLDEAQNVKNPDTKQARSARSLPADYRIALTGTPVENHVGDLWSIFEFLNPGFLGNQAEFRRRFFIPIQAQQDEEASRRLKRLTGPFLLRRLKTDQSIIADLPEKLEMKVFCTLTKEQATLYAAVVDELSGELKGAEGIKRRGVILGTLLKLKQVCNHPTHFLGDHSPLPGRSGKLARLTEMLEEVLETGERALVFTQFTEMGELLKQHLQEELGREVLFLHGGVPREQRARMVERFQSGPGGPRLFVLSLKAGGTGLNLTAANHVFHFDRWWNPAVENQATDRAFRIGQHRNVQVHKFVCVGTLEEKIDEMIERKQAVAERVVGSGEAWLTELSNDQLRDLFTLRQEAVED